MILQLAITLLIFVESALLGMLGENFVVPTLAAIAVVLWLIRPLQYEVSLGVKILVPTLLVGFFFFRFVSIPELFSRTEWIFPTNVTVALAECFLIGQIFELIKRQDPREGLLNFSLLAMAVVVCTCCRVATGSDKSILFVGSVICVTLICTIFQYSTGFFVRNKETGRQNLAFRSFLISLTILMVGGSSWYLSGFFRGNIEGFQNWWLQNFQAAGLGVTDTAIQFDSDATLTNITNLKKSNPMKPALRIYCDTAPGYLRGRVYDRFEGTGWERSRQTLTIEESPPPPSITGSDDSFFKLEDKAFGEFKKVRVENQVAMSYFFLPLNATYLSGKLSNQNKKIRMDRTQVLIGGITSTSAYSGYVEKNPPQPKLSVTEQSRLTGIPDVIEPQVIDLAREVTRGRVSDADRMQTIENFFRGEYSYSLNQKEFPADRDKVSYFILEKPAAHCEFFASAAVIFLRANGIPARYVTGFATEEISSDDTYYIARNKDAHAWAEAYDREANQWVVIEATPGTELPKSIWDQASQDETDSTGGAGNNSTATARFRFSGFFQQMWVQLREFFGEIGRQLRGPLNIALSALILFGLFYRFWWKRRTDPLRHTRLGRLERERQLVERRLARYRLVRGPNESMLQFENRIAVECDERIRQQITNLLAWFRDYETARFGLAGAEDPIPVAPATGGNLKPRQ
ncbi:MAG: transglutaminaseTgpA domain-containing protein [Planctomycetota bacterium]|nr:transglutaminaseTgpA domain-containing protein [Planctomycetota bacterium]